MVSSAYLGRASEGGAPIGHRLPAGGQLKFTAEIAHVGHAFGVLEPMKMGLARFGNIFHTTKGSRFGKFIRIGAVAYDANIGFQENRRRDRVWSTRSSSTPGSSIGSRLWRHKMARGFDMEPLKGIQGVVDPCRIDADIWNYLLIFQRTLTVSGTLLTFCTCSLEPSCNARSIFALAAL